MQFDPALAAQTALTRLRSSEELGDDLDIVLEAEELFSSSAGPEARAAYDRLQDLGSQHPHAEAFQQFLIYITWQQVTEETIPAHFETGVRLCDQYLARWGTEHREGHQILALRASFRAGLGLEDEDDTAEYDQDTFKGGD